MITLFDDKHNTRVSRLPHPGTYLEQVPIHTPDGKCEPLTPLGVDRVHHKGGLGGTRADGEHRVGVRGARDLSAEWGSVGCGEAPLEKSASSSASHDSRLRL